jgi:hypothetical protein
MGDVCILCEENPCNGVDSYIRVPTDDYCEYCLTQENERTEIAQIRANGHDPTDIFYGFTHEDMIRHGFTTYGDKDEK